ncbi:3-oxoadipate enol-lactonase [Caldimonas thermodepolymerans]|jgi:3-oxoadipate enol-lactonase|uniref:3-oxoadipate enol-lactonase n=1 Tax=Caldimonas thermodepolymerans TaxID=215580 RepID=A0AA46DB01_9BURK|nr:3-oxoadipate enol-lactonase [Caldimonas thermodepolymerans]TCP04163.1 3-oxoadipate enol-lactonase [Caldimonas thermodepolymerans]UZG47424.1 3-oxoadipate enol-lactonase [Caldimonas thermodepolymerans]
MDDRQDDFDRGLRNRRAVLGDAWVDRSLGNATAFNADFVSLITRYAWHDIWGRPGLDHRTRRLLVLGMTIAQGRWEEYELHLRAAVEGGVPLDEIKETLMQAAIYCGVPAANTAFKLAGEVLAKLGITPAPQPLTPAQRVARHHTFSAPQLHVLRQGQGRPVVLSHALGLDVQMWDRLAAALAGDCEVLRYDHRGHGESAVPPGPYTMDELVEDAARLVREWGRGPVVWIGLSMGGMVGQGLAARHPELVQSLVVANSTSYYPDAARGLWAQRIATVEAQGLAGIADGVMGRYFTEAFRAAHPEVEAWARGRLLRTDAAGYVACCHAVSQVDWREALPRITCPTLVIAGAQDVGAPVAMSEAIAQAVPGARLEIIDGASHISVLEAPEAFERLVRDFLAAH